MREYEDLIKSLSREILTALSFTAPEDAEAKLEKIERRLWQAYHMGRASRDKK